MFQKAFSAKSVSYNKMALHLAKLLALKENLQLCKLNSPKLIHKIHYLDN